MLEAHTRGLWSMLVLPGYSYNIIIFGHTRGPAPFPTDFCFHMQSHTYSSTCHVSRGHVDVYFAIACYCNIWLHSLPKQKGSKQPQGVVACYRYRYTYIHVYYTCVYYFLYPCMDTGYRYHIRYFQYQYVSTYRYLGTYCNTYIHTYSSSMLL